MQINVRKVAEFYQFSCGKKQRCMNEDCMEMLGGLQRCVIGCQCVTVFVSLQRSWPTIEHYLDYILTVVLDRKCERFLSTKYLYMMYEW